MSGLLTVTAEDVAEAASNNKRDLVGEDGSRGLFSGRARAERVSRYQHVVGLDDVAELGVVVLHAHGCHLLGRHAVLVGVLARIDAIRVDVVVVACHGWS